MVRLGQSMLGNMCFKDGRVEIDKKMRQEVVWLTPKGYILCGAELL